MGTYIKLFETASAYTEARKSEYIEPWVSYTRENEEVDYNKSEYEKLLETPLTFEVLTGGTFTFYQPAYLTWSDGDEEGGGYWSVNFARDIYYKINDGEWVVVNSFQEGDTYSDPDYNWYNDTIVTLNVSAGDEIQFKAYNQGYFQEDLNLNVSPFKDVNFVGGQAMVSVKGNILSMFDSDMAFPNVPSPDGMEPFSSFFGGRKDFVYAENLILPSEIPEYGYNYYYSMFSDCTSLTTAPELPATTLVDSCYANMFQGCTSLTAAPELPAETLANGCYQYMFSKCTSLTQAPSTLPATTLAINCYQSMFQNCTSLTSAPELPATTLANGCYNNMFGGCTNLNYIKCLATNISASNSHTGWVSGVASSGTFVKAAGISESTWGRDKNGIPTNWTVQDAS